MHRFRSGIAGIVLGVAIGGCGGSVDEGSHDFKPTDTKPFDTLIKEQQEKMKKKDYTQKAEVPEEKKSKEAGKK